MARYDLKAADNAAELIGKYEGIMYRAALSLLHNHHDAEDAVGDAFVSLCRAGVLPDARDPGTKALLLNVVRKKAADIFNRNAKASAESLPEDRDAGPGKDIDSIVSLKDAIAKLPEDLRDALQMNVYHGLSTKEIAVILGVKQDTVQKRIKRAREILKKELGSEN